MHVDNTRFPNIFATIELGASGERTAKIYQGEIAVQRRHHIDANALKLLQQCGTMGRERLTIDLFKVYPSDLAFKGATYAEMYSMAASFDLELCSPEAACELALQAPESILEDLRVLIAHPLMTIDGETCNRMLLMEHVPDERVTEETWNRWSKGYWIKGYQLLSYPDQGLETWNDGSMPLLFMRRRQTV